MTILTASDLPEGITFRSTPGHGYWYVSAQRYADMPKALKMPTDCYRGGTEFEEDLEYNRVVLAFADEFPDDWVEKAHEVMKNWHPDVYEAWTGEVVPLEESREKRERLFHDVHKSDYLALSAQGDWHDKVPDGQVAVFAGRGGRLENGQYPNDVRWFMVSQERYRSRTDGLSYVIDLEVDREFEGL